MPELVSDGDKVDACLHTSGAEDAEIWTAELMGKFCAQLWLAAGGCDRPHVSIGRCRAHSEIEICLGRQCLALFAT